MSTKSSESHWENLVSWLRERPGTELLSGLIGIAAALWATYLVVVRAPELIPWPWWVTGVFVTAAGVGGAAGWGYLTRETDIAIVEIDGEIRRDTPSMDTDQVDADEVCDAIKAADEEAAGLLVTIDSPGGEPVPSEDIRRAIQDFDGPTVASARDLCASGGYLLATGCDEIFAREGGMVGSIGVLGSRINLSDLAGRLGVSYERLTAGEYKDAGVPLDEMDSDDRTYLQGLIDSHYELFIERVAESRGLDSEAVRATDARLFTGKDAHERALVDELGDQEDAKEYLADLVGRDIETESVTEATLTPRGSPLPHLTGIGSRIAYGIGSGIGDRLTRLQVNDRFTIELNR